MRDFKNLSARNLEMEEHRALLDCVDILEKAFKKKIHSCQINPNKENQTDIWGISFAFDLWGVLK